MESGRFSGAARTLERAPVHVVEDRLDHAYSEDLEQAVLAAMFMAADAISAASRELTRESFYVDKHRRIYDAMLAVHQRGVSVDPLTLCDELVRRGELEAAGGKDYIGYLVGFVPTHANVEHHVGIVRDYCDRRLAVEQLDAERQAILDGQQSMAEIRQQSNTFFSSLLGRKDKCAGPVFLLLADLLRQPALLQPPRCVVPRFAYAGRATLLVAPAKGGKTTLAGHMASAVTARETFLSERVNTETGRVVWWGLEEALGDPVRRFRDLSANSDRIQLVTRREAALLSHTRRLLTSWPADLLVIDSLTEYARLLSGKPPDDGDTAGWAAVIRPLVELTREYDPLSALILHHPRRSDGRYRGPAELAAAVDMTLELKILDKDPCVRAITGEARWPVEPFSIALRDGRYELADGTTLSLDARVMLQIEKEPGVSLTKLRDLVRGRAQYVDETVKGLLASGAIERRGKGGLWPLRNQLKAGAEE